MQVEEEEEEILKQRLLFKNKQKRVSLFQNHFEENLLIIFCQKFKMSFSFVAVFFALFISFVLGQSTNVSNTNSSVILNYFGSVNCVPSGPSNAPSAFSTQVRSSNGVCNVVEGAGGKGGSWAVNCATSGDGGGDLFFCSDSACKEGCQKQPFTADVCIPITVQAAPNSAASFMGKCIKGPVVSPGAEAISSGIKEFISVSSVVTLTAILAVVGGIRIM